MKTIPQIREELLKLAQDINSNSNDLAPEYLSRKIKKIVKSLYRRPAVRRAAKEHTTVTPELSREIKMYALTNPDMSYANIGARFNVSIGRVSEIVAGKRAA